MLPYPAGLDLSTSHLRFLTGLLARNRRVIGSRWRRLAPGRQALCVLAYLRVGDTYPRLAAGFGIGVATVYRYVREAVDLLAGLAPDLPTATGVAAGKAYVILDGTLVRIDRVGMATGADRPSYSGKHKRHGLNVQVLADPAGRLLWASPALPGSTHDLTAARTHGLIDVLAATGRTVFADRGYQGAGGTVRVPFRSRGLPAGPHAVNCAHARIRAVGERGAATLKNWRVLRRIRCCPHRGTALVAAILTLHLHAN